MNVTAIINGTIFTPNSSVNDKALLLEGDHIQGLADPADIPPEAEIMDATGLYVSPGLIDLQIYGAGNCLFSAKPSPEGLVHMADALIKQGTTSFLPTLATNTPEIFHQAITAMKQVQHPAILGLHFEGPWLNPEKRGAHPAALITVPQEEEVEAWIGEAAGTLRMVTLAPERCDPVILELLVNAGIVLSAGHSNATFTQAVAGFDRGIRTVTHLFNAMSPFHHRETGLPGAVFQSDHIFASIIADGIHVDYKALSISKRLMGGRLFLITDAVVEASEGTYQHIKQVDHYTLPNGTLSGSALSMLQAVANCVNHAGIDLEEALRMATLYPATVIGEPLLGRITAGCKANILLFSPDFEIKQVLFEGERIVA